MANQWYSWCLFVGDAAFGWMVQLPRDISVISAAIAAALFLLVIRKLFSNQQMLRSVHHDLGVLRRRLRVAKGGQAKAELKRVRTLRSRVLVMKLRGEAFPTIVALIPFAAFVTWGNQRLHFKSPQAGETYDLTLTAPVSMVGSIAYVVPSDHVRIDRPTQRLERKREQRETVAECRWNVQLHDTHVRSITIRIDAQTLEHSARVGSTVGSPSQVRHPRGFRTKVSYAEYKPLGLIPARVANMPAWAIAFTIVTAILFVILRRLMRVA